MDKTYKWDMAGHIKTKDDVIGYLEAALEEKDTELLFEVIGDITRSEGMAQLAREMDLSGESLYRSFSTVVKLFDLLGYRVVIKQKTA
jgi:probable addiction module antidote protein